MKIQLVYKGIPLKRHEYIILLHGVLYGFIIGGLFGLVMMMLVY